MSDSVSPHPLARGPAQAGAAPIRSVPILEGKNASRKEAVGANDGGGTTAEDRLLAVLAWEPIHPTVAVALIADLSRSLVEAVLSPADRAGGVHRQLLRLAQTCVDAADGLERAMADGGRFEWPAPFRIDERLNDVERRLAAAERRLKAEALRQERVEQAAATTEADCAFP